MKLISLNIWGGILRGHLKAFLDVQKREIDIFCFQEVWSNANPRQFPYKFRIFNPNIFEDIKDVLNDFNAYFAPANSGMVGVAIFVRKSIKVNKAGEMFAYPFPADPAVQNKAENLGKKFQWIEFSKAGKNFTVCNFHGVWDIKRGLDTETRMMQSRKIRRFLNEIHGPKILCAMNYEIAFSY